MILIISGDQGSNKSKIALGLIHHAAFGKLYDEFPPEKPADFPKTNRVLVVICTNMTDEYPAWINNHPFTELQTRVRHEISIF